MIPNFTSTSDMLGFLRALPKDANYTKMLKDDFNIEAPTDAPEWQKEYLWKYGVQGKSMGLDGVELITYAAESAQRFIADHPYQLVHQRFQETADTKKPKTSTTKVAKDRPQGSSKQDYVKSKINADSVLVIEYTPNHGKWSGFIDGICVSRGATPEKIAAKIAEVYGVTKTEIKPK